MISIEINPKNKIPLYQQIYWEIRQKILSGEIKTNDKLPSKRTLSSHLGVSINTIENAYGQLLAEGYIQAVNKKGYYVNMVEKVIANPEPSKPEKDALSHGIHNENNRRRNQCVDESGGRIYQDIDESGGRIHQDVNESGGRIYQDIGKNNDSKYQYIMDENMVDTEYFPFSVWSKLMRESLRDEYDDLINKTDPQGHFQLREEIAEYLFRFRNMEVSPHQIILGAGTEYLFGILTELLRNSIYAIEDPCYQKTVNILDNRNLLYHDIPVDEHGINTELLTNTTASIVYVRPSRHFPLGTVMSIGRRSELLNWAQNSGKRYIIEDDYDSEYRFELMQIPSLYSLDSSNKVIYINTFARTLAPSLRLGYMILPGELLTLYKEKLSFYSCTVSGFEQDTLRRFIKGGYYERHIYKMLKIYRERRNILLDIFSGHISEFEISGCDGGLYLTICSKHLRERDMVDLAGKSKIKVTGLSDYFIDKPVETNTVVTGYGGYNKTDLKVIGNKLLSAWCVH